MREEIIVGSRKKNRKKIKEERIRECVNKMDL